MLKLNVDSLEAVDEGLRAFYVEKDGKFALAVEGLDDLTQEAVTTATRKANKEAIDERKKRQAWERLGKTPDEIAELVEAQEKTAQTEAEKRGEWDKLRGQMNEKHAAELRARDEKLAAKDNAVAKYLIDSQATAAIAAAGGKPRLLLPHVKQHMKVVDDDGEFVVRVVDAKGDPRVNGKGDPLSVSELIAEMRQMEDFGTAFEGSGQAGLGMKPSNGNGAIPSKITRRSDLKDKAERIAWVQTHGNDAYLALPY